MSSDTASALEQSNRALRMLSDSNQVLIRASNIDLLLREICRIAVDVGGYPMAWIGLVDEQQPTLVKPVAHAGPLMGFLPAAVDTAEVGNEQFARALTTCAPLITTAFGPREEAARQRGYVAAIVVPLVEGSRSLGTFKVYTCRAGGFEAGEVAILSELAGDIGYGLVALRTRAERDRSIEQQYLLNFALDHVSESIFLMKGDSPRFTYVNQGAADSLGYTREELTSGMAVTDIDPTMSNESWEQLIAMMREKRHFTVESTHRTKAGAVFPIEVSGNYFDHQGTTYNLAIARDVTERRRAEETLRTSERSYRTLVENTPDIILRFDHEGRLLFSGGAITTLLGDPPHALEQLVESVRHELGAPARELAVTLGLNDGVHHFEARIIPEPDREQVTKLVVVRDLTRQRQLEAQLRQSQKMEAIGQLAGGIAHDFNNMLAVIQMQTSLLRDEPLGAEVRESIDEIQAAADRASAMTRQLLTFSRRDVRQPVDLDVSVAIGGMTKLLRRLIGEHIELETRFAPSLPFVHADPGMLEQVLMNLAINARDAMPGAGRLTIALDQQQVTEGQAALRPGARAGTWVRLSVHDSGSGIAPDVLPHIFEPFFTTKAVGKGTGLGLATVFGIVEQHHGWIEVHSKLGVGTTFDVLLPAIGTATTVEDEPATKPNPRGVETILLVEDEPAVRRSTRRTLERLGYRVLEADSMTTALGCWAERGAEVQLLLTDLVMPGPSGLQLAATLRKERPGLPVLFVTGYSAEAARVPGFDTSQPLLKKPFGATELATAVRAAIDTAVTRR